LLLIITNKTDLTTDYLILRLEELNIPFWRLNTEEYLSEYEIDIFSRNNSLFSSIRYYNGSVLSKEDLQAVYFRRPVMPDISSGIENNEVDFAEREVSEVLRSLWRIIDEKLWLNHPKYLWLANNKVEQLKIATSLGFNIPPTCISTCYNSIKNFYNKFNGDVIIKAVKHGFYKQDRDIKIATTQQIDQDFIDNFNEYAKVPVMFQKKIKKKFDIRVTVVGNKVYPTAIHSQDYEETKLDWRLWDNFNHVDLKHEKYELPKEISQLCKKITQKFNLRFSAVDLIYANNNKYYFLEMNPNGQWAWIEEKVGFPIRDSIIEALGVSR
jgi:glutathione synthase/RimK-type ligase-like ATP-grasp enzyme